MNNSTAPSVVDYINAHRKFILAAIAAVLVFFVADTETADQIVVAANAILILFVPNSQSALEKVYPATYVDSGVSRPGQV